IPARKSRWSPDQFSSMTASFSPNVVRARPNPDFRRRSASSLPSWWGMETTRGRDMVGSRRRTIEDGRRITHRPLDLILICPLSPVVRLSAGRVTLHAARIGGGATPAALARRCREAAFRPVRPNLDEMAAALELAHGRLRQPALDDEHARPSGARPERARKMLGVPRWRVDRLLQVHARVDMTQQELGRPLVLLVAARRAPGEVGFAVA